MIDNGFTLYPLSLTNRENAGLLEIGWSDGSMQRLPHQLLRGQCQCADCRAARLEDAGESARPITPTALPVTMLVEMRPVGTYGVQLVFSDGHKRGIYPWSYLYGLGHAG